MATYPTLPPGNSLASIQQKVRRLTRSPSEAQLTTDDLNNYINTCVLYDLPEHLRMFNLHRRFKFWTNPYQDVYYTNTAGYGNASAANQQLLYDFQNEYLTINPPLYVAGFQSFYTQSREEFFQIYPNITNISQIGAPGDGITTTFSGVVTNAQGAILSPGQSQQTCFVKREVLFGSVDVNGNGTSLVDVPVLDSTTGQPTIYGNLYNPNSDAYQQALANPPLATVPYINDVLSNNYINYVTGQYVITFPVAPGVGQQINSQTVQVQVSLPQAVCYYDNTFIVRPVPDQPYEINFEVYVRPAQLLQTNSVPELQEWWQYIAYLAAKKIFEDRMDLESVQMIMPELNKQERLCLRRTIKQITNERSPTIYTEQTGGPGGNYGWWGTPGSNF
ncbi:MAG TPA: hypothetical protein VHA52_02315 [Candidatus Babeliaceae bacterium]|nr:hypothetical protein [Candidatus Babeliaceae bacterium]